MTSPWRRLVDWLEEPAPVLRLEIVRIFAPLAVLGFMAPRLAHCDEWMGRSGFRVPDRGGAVNQPLYIPALPPVLVWTLAAVMVASGLACSFGWRTRVSALVFAGTLIFVTLSDRAAAFTVSKISPAVMIALAFAPGGKRVGVDAWLALRRGESPPARTQPVGSLRFLQVFLPVFYCASGIAKARGEWLTTPYVLFTHLHDSYQTPVAFVLASVVPGWGWTAMQGVVLAFEGLAPLWYALRATRTVAWVVATGMHVMIGLMFGPVIWFALLMIALGAGAYLPDAMLARLETLATRIEDRCNPAIRPGTSRTARDEH
jgi:hypothetical protein